MKDLILDIETTGLDPLKCIPTFIGIEDHTTNNRRVELFSKFMISGNMLKEFLEYERIITWSTPEDFDVPFLRLHMWKYGVVCNPKQTINLATVYKQHFEQAKWKGLRDFCRFFDIEVPEEKYTGADMPMLWWRKEFNEIIDHLHQDLDLIRKIYNKALEMRLI